MQYTAGRWQVNVFNYLPDRMVVAKIRYEEGSYEGEVGEGKVPEGTGTFEYR